MSRQNPRKLAAAAVLRAIPWLVVLASMIIGYRAVLPPSPLPDSTAPTQFSAERAAAHVEIIASEPHEMGSAAIEEVRAYITSELEALGLEVEPQRILRRSYFEDRIVPVVNLLARIPGIDSSGAIALMAHYDTVPATPGANDNTAAVAALLETGRALLAGPPIRNDILLLFTDSEEPQPRYGSVAFVADNQAFGEISLIINLETNGGGGASLLSETSGPEKWLVSQLGQIGSRPSAFSFLTDTARLIGDIGTDFDKFRNAGTNGFQFAYIQGSNIYHTPDDNIGSLSLGSMQHHGDHTLGIARHFGDLDLDDAQPNQRAVYFSLPSLLVIYPASWAIPIMMLAVVGVASGLLHRRKKHGAKPFHQTGLGFVFSLAAIVGGTVLWMLITALRPSLGLVEAYLAFAVVTTGASAGLAWANKRFRPEAVRGQGSSLPLLVLAAVTALVGVGFSYLFALPALAIGIALWISDGEVRQQLRFAIVAVVTVLLTVPAIDVFISFASPRPGNPGSDLAATFPVPLGLALLAIGLLRSFWPQVTED